MAQSEQEIQFSVACPGCGRRYQVPVSYRGRQIACKACGKDLFLEPAPSSEKAPDVGTPSDRGADEPVSGEDKGLVLGRLALKHRFLDEEQLKEAISIHQEEKHQGKRPPLGSVLVRKGFITQKHLDFLLSVQMMMETRGLDRQFGVIAVENHFVKSEDVEAALKEQEHLFKEKRSVRLIGEILVEQDKMAPGDRDAVLARQHRLDPGGKSEISRPAATPSTRPPEPASSPLSDPLDELFRLNLSSDGLTASITPCDTVLKSITAEDLKAFLERHEVIYGLLPDDVLDALIREEVQTGHSFTVAQGTPPKPGLDARIIYHFDTDPLRVGTIKEGGNIDFKDKGEIPQVQKGDLLAERVPPEEGIPGTDVMGRAVPPPKPRNRKIRKGKGTVLSEDGLQLTADQSGRPEVSAYGKVFVFSEHKIEGDVDLKSGHVDFEGDIYVTGTVQKGFRVRGGSLTANEIAGGKILIRGDVVVSGGIIGADIQIGGNLRARYINNSRIRAFGDVVIEKEAIDSEVETSGAFIINAGPVYSSKIIAKKGIWAAQVGSETSNPCLLIVGTDDRVKNEIQGIQARIDRVVGERDALHKTIDALNRDKKHIDLELGKEVQQLDAFNVRKRQLEEKIGEARRTGDKDLESKIQQAVQALESEIRERDKALEAYFSKEEALTEETGTLKHQIEEKEARIETLKAEIEHIDTWSKSEEAVPMVDVYGKLFPYTVIKGRNTALTFPEGHQNLRIKETHYEDPADGKEWKLRLSPLKK
ncbi:MAG: flagellar assembly protein A [Thermodesulfobacteriota bacterium]